MKMNIQWNKTVLINVCFNGCHRHTSLSRVGRGRKLYCCFLWKNDSVSNVMARIVGIQDMSLLAIAASDVS